MIARNTCIALLLLAGAGQVLAETPAALTSGYAAEAAKSTPGFAPSAQRGQGFVSKDWGVSGKMASCTTCHGANLKADGKHVITGKSIAPLSPAVNPERFTSLAKAEKWFKRNCTEVVGRECTAAEKADFIQFVTRGG
ncbi:MAG: DUF1924 domain-containing protein [Nitrosomonadales bacterium]|nr:DUF1924 domain-containing protein [Nitrosomonadales bacterium]